jgi:hypothetical protein
MLKEKYKNKFNIPEDIKELMDVEFQRCFLDEMHMVFGWAIDTFGCDDLFNMEGTAGWNKAFKYTCQKTNHPDVLKYYNSLNIDDSDNFDDAFLDMMMEGSQVLPGWESDEIEKQYALSSTEFEKCCKCGGYYINRDLDQVVDEETGEAASASICKGCQGIKITVPITINIHQALQDYLGLSEKDIFFCKECHHYHLTRYKAKTSLCKHCENKLNGIDYMVELDKKIK